MILFAALSYAITQSNRGSAVGANAEQLEIAYAKYSGVLDQAQTDYLHLTVVNGCDATDIPGNSEDTPSAKIRCNFFSKHGGPFPYLSETTPDAIPPYVRLMKISLPGFGTAADDIIAFSYMPDPGNAVKLPDIKDPLQLCRYINKKNAVSYAIPLNVNIIDDYFKTLQSADTNSPLADNNFNGKRQFCGYNAPTHGYLFIQVIQER